MIDKTFDTPVFVSNGNSVRRISNLFEAWQFLEEWPKNQRNGFYEIAQWACASGFSGRMTLSAAREGFAAWAKSAGILRNVSETLPRLSMTMTDGEGIAA